MPMGCDFRWRNASLSFSAIEYDAVAFCVSVKLETTELSQVRREFHRPKSTEFHAVSFHDISIQHSGRVLYSPGQGLESARKAKTNANP
jgi:hypothetical protein